MQFVNIYFINLKLNFHVNVSFHRTHIILQHEHGHTTPFEYKKKDLPCGDIIAFFTSFNDVQDIP